MGKKISYAEMMNSKQLSAFFTPIEKVVEQDAFASAPILEERAFLDEERVVKLCVLRDKVKELLSDGEWHALEEIREVGGSSGDRRLRELRSEKYGGLNIEKMHLSGKDSFLYRWNKDVIV